MHSIQEQQKSCIAALLTNCYDAAGKLAAAVWGKKQKYHIFFKPHPRDRNFDVNRLKFRSQGDISATKDLNIDRCIEFCDYFATVNSTVTSEALLRNKPLILFGNYLLDYFNLPGKVRVLDQINEIMSITDWEFE